jgi:hypothetical protein
VEGAVAQIKPHQNLLCFCWDGKPGLAEVMSEQGGHPVRFGSSGQFLPGCEPLNLEG